MITARPARPVGLTLLGFGALLVIATPCVSQDLHLPPRIEPWFAEGEVLLTIIPDTAESFLGVGSRLTITDDGFVMQRGSQQSETFLFEDFTS